MRALIFELRPEAVEKEGLVAALNRQIDAVRARQGISAQRINERRAGAVDRGQARPEPDRPGVPLEHGQARPRRVCGRPSGRTPGLGGPGDSGRRHRVRPQWELPRAPWPVLDARARHRDRGLAGCGQCPRPRHPGRGQSTVWVEDASAQEALLAALRAPRVGKLSAGLRTSRQLPRSLTSALYGPASTDSKLITESLGDEQSMRGDNLGSRG